MGEEIAHEKGREQKMSGDWVSMERRLWAELHGKKKPQRRVWMPPVRQKRGLKQITG